MPRTISQFINGQSVTRIGAVTSPVYDPSTGQVQARLEHGDAASLAEVVAVAKAAQPAWAAINPQRRARVMFRSVLARLRCYHAPRRFQRDVVAHHFPDVILQFCLNAEHGIDSL
jgi:hypothetical protein